jgi:hypothetical protein
MLMNRIGENAGKIWLVLKKNEILSLRGLKNIFKEEIDEKSLLLSLGWLAREGKVILYISDNGYLAGMIYE